MPILIEEAAWRDSRRSKKRGLWWSRCPLSLRGPPVLLGFQGMLPHPEKHPLTAHGWVPEVTGTRAVGFESDLGWRRESGWDGE